MTIGGTSSEATLEVQPSGDQMKCRSKPLAKECRLIATPIHHDERKKKSYTGSGVAMAIGEPRIVVDKLVTRPLAETGEPRISAGKEATRPKRKEHQIAAVKPTPVAASAADKDSHSETDKACSEQQTTKKGKTRLRFQWTLELKNDLLEMYTSVKDQTGYMKKLKDMWDAKYPDHKHLAANTLSDNARRLTKLKIVPPQEIQIIADTKPKAINVAEIVDVIEQIRPTNIDNRIEQPNMESTRDICQNLIEQLRKIFKTTLPIIQEGNIDRKPILKQETHTQNSPNQTQRVSCQHSIERRA